MATKPTILNSIAEIETALRGIAAQASRDGDWPVVRAVSLAAEQLESLRPVAATPKGNRQASTADLPDGKPRTRAAAAKTRKGRGGYPRFVAEGDDLVKVGWSKKEKAEYRHRVSVVAGRVVVDAIRSELTETGTFFSADTLLPVIDPTDGSEVPGYQVYLVIRWLRDLDLIRQQGRSGYAVTSPNTLAEAFDQAWQQLQQS